MNPALPAGNLQIAEAQFALGACLSAMQRYGDAEPLLVASHSALRAAPVSPAAGADLEAATIALVTLYDRWGKPERGAEYRALVQRRPAGSKPPRVYPIGT